MMKEMQKIIRECYNRWNAFVDTARVKSPQSAAKGMIYVFVKGCEGFNFIFWVSLVYHIYMNKTAQITIVVLDKNYEASVFLISNMITQITHSDIRSRVSFMSPRKTFECKSIDEIHSILSNYSIKILCDTCLGNALNGSLYDLIDIVTLQSIPIGENDLIYVDNTLERMISNAYELGILDQRSAMNVYYPYNDILMFRDKDDLFVNVMRVQDCMLKNLVNLTMIFPEKYRQTLYEYAEKAPYEFKKVYAMYMVALEKNDFEIAITECESYERKRNKNILIEKDCQTVIGCYGETIYSILCNQNIFSSRSSLRRLILGGAVRSAIDNSIIDLDATLSAAITLKIGKYRYIHIEVDKNERQG